MKRKNYLWTLYLISIVILFSIVIQVYFNYSNYQKNKLQFINEVQISLDNAVDNYFAELAKKEFVFPKKSKDSVSDLFIRTEFIDKTANLDFIKKGNVQILDYTLFSPHKKVIVKSKNGKKDSKYDSIIIKELSTIFISITKDSIKLSKLKTFLDNELKRKGVAITYQLNSFKNNIIDNSTNKNSSFKKPIKTYAKSTFLAENEKLEMVFANQSLIYLKRGIFGILLSLLFSLAIISALFYLLHIIKKQKAIAEIKNDFISNITHEFKTPITTIGLALEGVKEFTKTANTSKTEEYLDISHSQLEKLNLMVEKVLETSFLDSEKLFLQKENCDIVSLLEKIYKKQQLTNPEKEITFKTNTSSVLLQLDVFHFENALNNLVENALKYGGNTIVITLEKHKKNIGITIADSGTIPKAHQQKIFDKFYRIPQGDKHDVKGFGIGLYYSKKIIEKHLGTLVLLNTKNTTFKIDLPYED